MPWLCGSSGRLGVGECWCWISQAMLYGKIVLSCFIWSDKKYVVLVPALDGFMIISIIKLCFLLATRYQGALISSGSRVKGKRLKHLRNWHRAFAGRGADRVIGSRTIISKCITLCNWKHDKMTNFSQKFRCFFRPDFVIDKRRTSDLVLF